MFEQGLGRLWGRVWKKFWARVWARIQVRFELEFNEGFRVGFREGLGRTGTFDMLFCHFWLHIITKALPFLSCRKRF